MCDQIIQIPNDKCFSIKIKTKTGDSHQTFDLFWFKKVKEGFLA